TTAQAGRGGIELANRSLQTGEGISQTTAVSVVEMERQFAGRDFQFFFNSRDGIRDLIGESHAVRVAESDSPRALFARCSNSVHQRASGYFPFERTMKTSGETHPDLDTIAFRFAADLVQQLEGLGHGAVQISPVEAFA